MRSARKQIAWQVGGGFAWESVDVNSLLSETMKTSDSQIAFYVKLAAEWKHVSVFIQTGLGFDDAQDSLVGWSNSLQFGTATVF